MNNVVTLDPKNLEIRQVIIEEGGEDIYKCYRCGKCMGVCPWYHVKSVIFPVYRIPQRVKLGAVLTDEEKEEVARETQELYRCAGCEACLTQCPHGVHIPNIMRAVRRLLVDFGSYPANLKPPISKIHSVGNPLGEPREKRTNWTQGLDIPIFKEGMEFLYFSCCLSAYEVRLQKVAQATAEILKKAGISFGILGEKEDCCSEGIRRAGAEKTFQETAKFNITEFKNAKVKKILTTSPHCYTVFKNEYPKLGGEFEVFHHTQLFSNLIKEGKLKPQKPLVLADGRQVKKIVYHDPCTLGYQNKVYDEPREILKSIPGVELVEIENFSRQYSVCCGGGSGGLWLDWPIGERIADVRVKQAIDTGADILATACPYCIHMLEESMKSMSVAEGKELEVKDVSELLAEAL